MFTRGYEINQNRIMSATTIPMVTELEKVGIYNEELLSININDPLITWSSDLISLIRYVGLEHKRVSRHRRLLEIF